MCHACKLIAAIGVASAILTGCAAPQDVAQGDFAPAYQGIETRLLDGDLVFAAATGARALADPVADQFALGHAAACCLARAIARAVYLAQPEPGDLLPAWSEKFGSAT